MSLGTLKLVTSHPIGLTLRKTFLTVPSLPDASRPWRTTRRAYRPSAYNADCSFLILLLSCLAAFLRSSPLGRPLGHAASLSPMRICRALVMGTSFAGSEGTKQCQRQAGKCQRTLQLQLNGARRQWHRCQFGSSLRPDLSRVGSEHKQLPVPTMPQRQVGAS